MKENLKKLFQYYKPYKHVFFIDMFFAFLASIIALVIPLVVRYVTSTVVYLPAKDVFRQLIVIAVVVTILLQYRHILIFIFQIMDMLWEQKLNMT